MTREEKVRKKFPAGMEVMATIYSLRHLNIWEPQRAIVESVVSEEEIRQGYRFGVRVLYEGKVHWVKPEDVKEIEE